MLPADQFQSTKVLNLSVYGHHRETQNIPDVGLCDREVEGAAGRQAAIAQPDEQLADQVCHASDCRSPAETRDPGTLDRGVDHGRQPQQPREVDMIGAEFLHRFMRYECDLARTKSDDAVVDFFQQKAVQINKVTLDVQSCKLPLTLFQDLRSGGHSRKDYAALLGPIAFADDF